jgi:pilus assembly protein Flp/PilA
VGETRQAHGLSDAAGGRPAGGLAARSGLRRFWRDEAGATAIEYGLIASLVFLVIVASVTVFGNKTSEKMQYVSDAIAAAIN